MFRFLILSFAIAITKSLSAQSAQNIMVSVVDNASNASIGFVSVQLARANFLSSGITDSVGNFTFTGISVGRYHIEATSSGYYPSTINDVTVSSAKETFVTIRLTQKISQLGEVIVKPYVDKGRPLNAMASVSARMLSVEESKRYAGGFDDPARLASSFAGVAGNTEVNGIIIRGNAPKFVQWRMEGIEIPNPNHFGDLKTFGGGALTALSSQMLANSDFFTGAFPAEYNNALSGVFDIAMRKGSNQKREHTLQAGIIGIDASSEGSFKKGGRSSYLFNYRYSTLALLQKQLPEDANNLNYQDFSFKLNFPTLHSGIFSIWGIGLADRAGAKAKTDSLKWEYKNDMNESAIIQSMLATGISHTYFFNSSTYLKTSIATTLNKTDWGTQQLNSLLVLQPFSKIGNINQNYVFSSLLNKKFNAAHTNRSGVTITGMQYSLFLDNSIVPNGTPVEIVNTRGFSTLISGYSNSAISLTGKLKLNVGVNGQYFTLNHHYTIEPRLGIFRQLNENNSIAFAYGLHSRLEQLNIYFNKEITSGANAVNKNLGFTKAHHFVFSYDWKPTSLIHVKIEPYFQQLFNVPVIADSSFSLLNLQGDWFFAGKLQNTGKGRNYGVDITLEKYLSNGFYYLFTASIFQAQYKGGDNIWRNNRYNRNYVFNLLAGKEWQTGKNKQNLVGLNARLNYQGGNRYSPVDEVASALVKDVVYDENDAFAMQAAPSVNIHFTASYKINRNKTSHEFSLKILNATRQPDFYGYKYNLIQNRIDKDAASVIIPNISYKIEF